MAPLNNVKKTALFLHDGFPKTGIGQICVKEWKSDNWIFENYVFCEGEKGRFPLPCISSGENSCFLAVQMTRGQWSPLELKMIIFKIIMMCEQQTFYLFMDPG